jgi:ABC-type transport system substrate-binding protein
VVKWNLDQQIAAKKTVASNWSSIDVIDDDTIRVNLKYWENLTISNITQVGIISKVAYDTLGDEALSNHPVGTGPFIFKSFNKDVSLEYEKFPDYWIAGKPYLDGIKYICISDIVTSVSAFTVGDADLTEASEAKVMYDLSQVPGVSFVYADTGTMVLKPDAANADSPWSNKLVRQAVEYAINKELLVKATGYGIFTKADQCALPGTIGYIPNLTPRNYDLAKAKQLMIDAGYPEGFETTLCYTQNGYKDGAVAIQAALQEININATLEYADSAKYGQYLSNGWHNTAIYTPAGGGSNFITGIRNLFMTPG